jgi:tetratricopeptide (TPR) repeat protein
MAWPLTPALALVVVLAQQQVRAAASAPQPPQGLDLGALITGWLQQYGMVGSVALVASGFFWAVLSQAQNIESAKRLLGWERKPEAPPPSPDHTTNGPNSPLITGGSFKASSHQFIGGEHIHTYLPPSPKPDFEATHTPHNLPRDSDSAVPFIGRDTALDRLAHLLEAGTAPVVITGMDGVGKTALALHHLRQRLEGYGGGVVMLDGQRPLAGLVEQLEQFAFVHFEQQVPEALPPEGRLAWLYSRWPLRERPVLLLLDELRDPAELQAMGRGLPERFRLLVTSRRQFGTASQRVTLEPLTEEQAITLLEKVSEREPFRDREKGWASDVVQEVGGLPLALCLLGRKLARDGDLELAELRRRLAEKGALARDLQPSPADPLQARGLCASFQLAWEGIGAVERELALLLGTLPPTPIPWELLTLCAPPGLDPDNWREARVGLEEQHLIMRHLSQMVSVHPLLHDLFAAEAREGMAPDHLLPGEGEEAAPGEERVERRGRLVNGLRTWLPRVSEVMEVRSRERSHGCLPLLETLAQWPAEVFGPSAAGLPLLALGRLRTAIGAYGPAEAAFELGMEQARDRGCEGADRVMAGCLVGLAGIARERGQLQTAERQCREALALLTAEPADPPRWNAERALERAEALNGLGLVLHELGAHDAEHALMQALRLRHQQLGDDDRLVQVSRNNLARNLARQGRFSEAKALYRRALEALRDDPCELGMAVHNNLAFLAMEQGRREEAFSELREAERLAEMALGEHHPRRGELLQHLAIVEEQLGHHRDAEAHYREALHLMDQTWGAEDPRTQECQLTLKAFLDEHQR